jgi:uncharacterized RDD family membrane protein YckC
MHYASIGRRFLAMVLDGMILLIPCAVAAHVVFIVGGLIVTFLYYTIFESSQLQATLGKHLMGIQVTGMDGQRIDFKTANLRLVLKLASMLFLFIGHFFAFFTERRQAFHDLVAGTVVLYGRFDQPIVESWVRQIREVFGVKTS